MIRFAPAKVDAIARDDGALLLRSPTPLEPYARCVGEWLVAWAARAPSRTFLAERDDAGGWRRVTYAEALDATRAIAQALIDRGASPTRPVMLLSDNAVDHALVQLAAMHVGVPAAPVSPAYSLLSADRARLRAIAACVRPAVLYAADGDAFAPALDAIATAINAPPRVVTSARPPPRGEPIERLRATRATADVDRAFAALGPDTIAKILFTSGSTGAPKGVVNTQRMLCANQQMIAQLWPFLRDRPPVIVDWLPWSHTFGGNHNFDMVLMHGGTLYVDGGKPAPGRLEPTLRNLREIAPTLSFNVPRGYEMIVPHLEEDDALRETFFRDLDLLFYAAAALPQATWERLERAWDRARGGRGRGAMVSAWGSTETAPLATSVHFPIARAGVIGLPAPGCEVKLAPVAEARARREIRVRGPNVTPGTWEAGGAVRPIARDEEGFLATGDAGRLEDARDPAKGIVFDGRIAENFKLSSGTWVSVGELRIALVAACAPLVQDAVIAGHDRDAIGALLFAAPALIELPEAERRARLAARIDAFNAEHAPHRGTSARVARALVLDQPPSIDGGEITDKGYVNQRAVLDRRAADVARLFAPQPDARVLRFD